MTGRAAAILLKGMLVQHRTAQNDWPGKYIPAIGSPIGDAQGKWGNSEGGICSRKTRTGTAIKQSTDQSVKGRQKRSDLLRFPVFLPDRNPQ